MNTSSPELSEQMTPRIEGFLTQAIDGIERFPGALKLAEQYPQNRLWSTPRARIQAMIVAESAASVGSGLMMNIGKLIIPVGVPDTRYVAWLIHARLAAAIARIYEHDLNDSRVRMLILVAVLGDAGRRAIAEAAVELSEDVSIQAMHVLPPSVQSELYRLAESMLMVPTTRETRSWRDQMPSVAGALINAIDPQLCYAIGAAAETIFRPAQAGHEVQAGKAEATADIAAADADAKPVEEQKRGWGFGKTRAAKQKDEPAEVSKEILNSASKGTRRIWPFQRGEEPKLNAGTAAPAPSARTISSILNDVNCRVGRHNWELKYIADGGCDQIETCTRCGHTRGESKVQHLLGDWVKAERVCVETQTCSRCGFGISREVSHLLSDWVKVERTCVESQTCTHCGASTSREVPHIWSQLIPMPGRPCERIRTCNHCGTEETGSPIHNFDAWHYESEHSCRQIWVCRGCSITRTGEIHHDFGEWITSAYSKCVEQKECRHCGHIETRQLRHDWTQPYYRYGTESSSCEQIIQCNRCGEEQQVDPKHTFSDWCEVGSNSCDRIQTCARCGEKIFDQMEHNWSDWSPVKRGSPAWRNIDPDRCLQSHRCLRCGEEEIEEIDHVWSSWERDLLCLQVRTCENCYKRDTGEIVHRPGDWEHRAPYSCQYVRRCRDCGQVAEEGEEKHSFGDWVRMPGTTCELHKVCSRCGKASEETTLDHAYQWVYDAYTRQCEGKHICTKCSAIQEPTFERHILHEYEWVQQEGECLAREICQRCGDESGETHELEHKLSEWVYVRQGSCDQIRSCTVCSTYEEQRVEHPAEQRVTESWNDNPKIMRTSCRRCKQQWFDHKELTTRGAVVVVEPVGSYKTQYTIKTLISGRKLTYLDYSRSLAGLSVGDQVYLVLTHEDDEFQVQQVKRQGRNNQ